MGLTSQKHIHIEITKCNKCLYTYHCVGGNTAITAASSRRRRRWGGREAVVRRRFVVAFHCQRRLGLFKLHQLLWKLYRPSTLGAGLQRWQGDWPFDSMLCMWRRICCGGIHSNHVYKHVHNFDDHPGVIIIIPTATATTAATTTATTAIATTAATIKQYYSYDNFISYSSFVAAVAAGADLRSCRMSNLIRGVRGNWWSMLVLEQH